MDWRDHIESVPGVLAGKPVVAGTRLSVEFLLGLLAQGWTEAQILESYPYQNSVRVLLQLDAPLDQIRAYAMEVEQIAQPLRPVLVFLNRDDPRSSLRAIAEQRGPEWTAYAAELITASPRAQRRGLHGLDGALIAMGEYKELVDELLRASKLPRLVLDDCRGRWEDLYVRPGRRARHALRL